MKAIFCFFALVFCVNVFCYSQTTNENEKNSAECSCLPKDDEIGFRVIEDMPRFPGGENARLKYLYENLKYLQGAIDSAIQGTVHLVFCIEKDGSISNVKVVRGIGDYIDEEVVRVVEAMPNWEPGKQRGRPVCVMLHMPIRFPLVEKSIQYTPIEQPENTPRKRNRKRG
jgi:TonB family protein